jgi:hypothetical protein
MSNHILKASAVAAALLGATPAMAANTAAMTSSALILKPFTLTKIRDLNFGTIIPTGNPEFVQIDADTGARTMTSETMRVASDDGFRAEFASSGVNNNMVFIELAGPANLVNGAGKLLKVTLALDQGDDASRTLTPASQVFFVGIGGEIYIRPSQEEGVYTGTYTLTATYI